MIWWNPKRPWWISSWCGWNCQWSPSEIWRQFSIVRFAWELEIMKLVGSWLQCMQQKAWLFWWGCKHVHSMGRYRRVVELPVRTVKHFKWTHPVSVSYRIGGYGVFLWLTPKRTSCLPISLYLSLGEHEKILFYLAWNIKVFHACQTIIY